ncbi:MULTISPECIES: AAA family ATPase [Pectobacterium]|uniref:AAA family ATPase n=1 Tax=Pectobacterium versatile TaxID=2488639 RepID=A0AAW3RTE1_9GAMM|nr:MULTISPECIES: AAA family ATPase [Pectobacterium]MBA0160308.1 AAA family ATPase [Pectobacterium versatile]POE18520.1 hypothetical protein BV923_21070 [Pectobacterium odoriferum]
MLTSLGVKNLRSFKEFTSIDLKPITVFIGKNSSGKSSFLRILPLLSQSTQETTNGPILWYGRLVDFGDFNNALNNNTEEKEIIFHFNIKVDERYLSYRYHHLYVSNSVEGAQLDIGVKLTITNPNLKTITKSVEINIDDTFLKIYLDEQKKESNIFVWNEALKIEKKVSVINSDGEFLPKIMFLMNAQDEKHFKIYPIDILSFGDEYLKGINFPPIIAIKKKNKAFYDELKLEASLLLKKYFHNKTTDANIKKILDEPLSKVSQNQIMKSLSKVSSNQTTFLKNLHACKNNLEEIKNIQVFSLINNFNSLSSYLNEQLKKSFASVKYIGPSRAIAERFYRFQDLQVNTLDHTGSNFAMILNSLSSEEKSGFKDWTKANFGFTVSVAVIDSHYAVKIQTEEDDNEYNISDMGFGYSQVLPIIMSIWLEQNRVRGYNNNDSIFVIEQPELHLHPAYQAKLAKVFALLIAYNKKNDLNVKIIFETHSQSMIDALGECIEDSDIDFNNNDVSVNVFEKINNNETKTYKAEFDKNGFFENWPVGFFTGN